MRWTTEKPEARGWYVHFAHDDIPEAVFAQPHLYFHKGGPLPDDWVSRVREWFYGPLPPIPGHDKTMIDTIHERVRRRLEGRED